MTSGADRRHINQRLGVEDHAIALPDDPFTTDELAAKAELYFGRRYGLEDQVQHDHPTTCDFKTRGLCIDVKWTPRQAGGLILRRKGAGQHFCDLYVLVVGREHMRIAGWTWAPFLLESWDEDLPKPAWHVRQRHLIEVHKLDELLEPPAVERGEG